MKQLLFILFTLTIVSCNTDYTPRTEPELTGNAYQDEDVSYAHEFTYKGHSYILFSTAQYSKVSNSGVVHNPTCKCFNDSIK